MLKYDLKGGGKKPIKSLLINFKLRNANDLYDLVTIKKLQEWTNERVLINPTSKINWKFLIRNQLGDIGKEVTDDTPIVVTNWDFLDKLMKLIDATSPRVLGKFNIDNCTIKKKSF